MRFLRTAHRSRRATAVVGAGALALVLAGCSGQYDDPTASPSPTTAQPIVDVLEGDDDAGLTVIAQGEDVLMLRLAQGVRELDPEEGQPLTGTLIVGPGRCLAVQPDGEPELLIFDASIGFADDPPRIRIEDTETPVGEQLSVQATQVQLAGVEGVPSDCAAEAPETAWVVHLS